MLAAEFKLEKELDLNMGLFVNPSRLILFLTKIYALYYN